MVRVYRHAAKSLFHHSHHVWGGFLSENLNLRWKNFSNRLRFDRFTSILAISVRVVCGACQGVKLWHQKNYVSSFPPRMGWILIRKPKFETKKFFKSLNIWPFWVHFSDFSPRRVRSMPRGKNLTSDKIHLIFLRIWRRLRSRGFFYFSSRPNINDFTGVGVFYWLDVLYTMLPQSIFWLLRTRVSRSFLAGFRRKKIRQNRYKIFYLMT